MNRSLPTGRKQFRYPFNQFFFAELRNATQSSAVAILVQLLVMIGAIVGRRRWYPVEASKHYPNEFCILAGESSKARKGTSWGWTKTLGEMIAPDFAGRIVSGLSTGEGLASHIRDARVEMQNQARKGEPPDYQEMVVDFGVEDKRLLAVESEFAQVLRQCERSGNNLNPVLRDAWDSCPLGTLNKNSPVRCIEPHIAIISHITDAEFRARTTSTDAANGFLNRFLVFSVARSKLLPFGGGLNPDALRPYADQLRENINRHDGLTIFTPPAAEIWQAVYGDLSRGRRGLAGAICGRMEAHAVRLALIYCISDGAPAIDVPHLGAALALVDYAEKSVAHVFGEVTGDPVADDIMAALTKTQDGLTRTDISNRLGRNRSAGQIKAALATLTEAKKVRSEKVKNDGHTTEWWFARS